VAASDVLVVERPAEVPAESDIDAAKFAPKQLSRATAIPLGLASFAAGIAAIVVATMGLNKSDATVRVLLSLAGLVVNYLGLRLLVGAIFGPRFDLSLWLCILWLGTVGGSAAIADLLPLRETKNPSKTLLEPILQRPDIFSGHPLGTDRNGLDVLGGVIYGARISLIVGIGAVIIGMILGSALGIAAGYYRGRFETVASVITDSMLAFPPLILLMAMVAVLAPSVRSVTISLAILGIPTYVRLSRANTLMFSQREFVLAARALGDTNRSIMTRELLPNVVLPILSFGFIQVAVLMAAEASLSFLGLSVQRPNPTWGNMIAAERDRFQEFPHMVFVPGAILFLTVLAFNRVGDRARELWDPRESKI
jgi:peptide/nickel transport system permease protein